MNTSKVSFRNAKTKPHKLNVSQNKMNICVIWIKKKGEAQVSRGTTEELSDRYGKADYEQFTTTSLAIRNETREWYKARCLETRRNTIGRKIVS